MNRRTALSIIPLSLLSALPAAAGEKALDLSRLFTGFDGTLVRYDRE
jgi:hypothetical protein